MATSRSRGFTLIEIVIVLAIAGLIMIMAFLALSGAETSRRDAQRKRDLQRLAAQLEFYASNNEGTYPVNLANAADWGAVGRYTPLNFNDPSQQNVNYFTVGYITGSVPGSTPGSLSYERGGLACDGVTPLSNNQFMVQMRLEQGGTSCIDDH